MQFRRVLKFGLIGYFAIILGVFFLQLAAMRFPALQRGIYTVAPAQVVFWTQGIFFETSDFTAGYFSQPRPFISQKPIAGLSETDVFVGILNNGEDESQVAALVGTNLVTTETISSFLDSGAGFVRIDSAALTISLRAFPLQAERSTIVLANSQSEELPDEANCNGRALYGQIFMFESIGNLGDCSIEPN
ncbi:hypothetical protein SAMN05444287_2219 [Octadecabacter temperatus]|uniref:Uncharacterized protein n=1 Tax=Octadecabacter temperatus TaxID=1458307 RepID=A0A0K0Y1Q8_9RHOB|nr:hypothetical protein [Octadecabacter temperatus]AKS44865.1 hypothetical protein OSB_02970 [Octadecabacter temperatus]SIO34312.1 hypothetical protein SAMN05444287_2219 [Octadecabacter temperatus]